MKDFITFDVSSSLHQDEIAARFRKSFPNLNWRGGDSDEQGPYLSGSRSDQTQLKIWLGENPVEISIAFPKSEAYSEDKEVEKKNFVFDVTEVIKSLGVIEKTNSLE